MMIFNILGEIEKTLIGKKVAFVSMDQNSGSFA